MQIIATLYFIREYARVH